MDKADLEDLGREAERGLLKSNWWRVMMMMMMMMNTSMATTPLPPPNSYTTKPVRRQPPHRANTTNPTGTKSIVVWNKCRCPSVCYQWTMQMSVRVLSTNHADVRVLSTNHADVRVLPMNHADVRPCAINEPYQSPCKWNPKYIQATVPNLIPNRAQRRKIAGSITDGVNVIFHSHNPSGRTMAVGFDSASNRHEYQEFFMGA